MLQNMRTPRRVQIDLEQQNGYCRMVVRDDGIGIDGARRQRPGLGIVTMRERAQAVGGEFKVRNQAGGGTHITIDIPAHDDTHTDRG